MFTSTPTLPISMATAIREWRADVRGATLDGQRVSLLVYAYNWATTPWTYHTEREHRVRRLFTRWVRRQLKRYRGWFETDSGRMVVAGWMDRWTR